MSISSKGKKKETFHTADDKGKQKWTSVVANTQAKCQDSLPDNLKFKNFRNEHYILTRSISSYASKTNFFIARYFKSMKVKHQKSEF